MKKLQLFVSALALAILASAGVDSREQDKATAKKQLLATDVSIEHLLEFQKRRNADRILGPDYEVFDSLENGFSFYNNVQKPLVYEPNTQTLTMILRGGILGDPVFNRNKGFIRISEDMGESWSPHYGPVNEGGDAFGDSLRYPNIEVWHNPELGTGIESLTWVHSFPFTNGGWGHYGVGAMLGDDLDPFSVRISPTRIGGLEFDWLPNTALTISPDGQTIIIVVPLDSPDNVNPSLNSNIGLIRFNYLDGDKVETSVPEQWATDQFVRPQGDGTTPAEDMRSSFVTKLGWDDSDNLYAGLYARSANSDDGTFLLPGVSKSTDIGQTWSEIDFMPAELLKNWISSQGAVPNADTTFFLGRDMHVLGENHVTFLFGFIDNSDDDGIANRIHQIVEVVYKDGEWEFRPVSPFSGLRFSLYHDQAESDLDGDAITPSPANSDQSQTQPDIQISPTLDGKFLIAKWADIVIYQDGEGNQFIGNDVFFAIRSTENDFWYPRVLNVTNTLLHDKITWIPDIIADVKNIPLIAAQTNFDALDRFNNSAKTVLDSNRAQTEVWAPQHVVLKHVNIREILATNVNEEPEFLPQITLHEIYPNPTGVETAVRFTLPESGVTVVDVYNTTGNRVATLQNGFLPAGENTLRFSTEELPVGSYYLNIVINGKTTAGKFTVIR